MRVVWDACGIVVSVDAEIVPYAAKQLNIMG